MHAKLSFPSSTKTLEGRLRRESSFVRKSHWIPAFAGTTNYFFFWIIFLTGCSLPKTNFSQYHGFAEYYAAHPPRAVLPKTQALPFIPAIGSQP